MSDQNPQSEVERPQAGNETVKPTGKSRTIGISLKVSEKGAVSVYGLGRFPVTLYKEQWERLLAASEDIKKFIGENGDKLKIKEQQTGTSA